jgi:hypothetical protein
MFFRASTKEVVLNAVTESLHFYTCFYCSKCPNEHTRFLFFRWFMPVNIGITFIIGGTLGWIACNILKPPQHFRGLIMAFCSAGSVSSVEIHVPFLFG